MRKSIATLGFIIAVSASPLAFAADFDWSPCKAEIDQYCKDTKGDEAIYQCLLKHDADLSKTCDNGAHSKYEELTGKAKH